MSNQKHRWYDVIVAWAEGKEIQYKWQNTDWSDFQYYDGKRANLPTFNNIEMQWRIKPKTVTKRYRMALLHEDFVAVVDVTGSCIDNPAEYDTPRFVRWLGEPVEVELEVNDENE